MKVRGQERVSGTDEESGGIDCEGRGWMIKEEAEKRKGQNQRQKRIQGKQPHC